MEKEIRTIYDQETGRAIRSFVTAFRCSDDKIFVTRPRAVEHELMLLIESKIDIGELDERTGEFKVLKASTKRASK